MKMLSTIGDLWRYPTSGAPSYGSRSTGAYYGMLTISGGLTSLLSRISAKIHHPK